MCTILWHLNVKVWLYIHTDMLKVPHFATAHTASLRWVGWGAETRRCKTTQYKKLARSGADGGRKLSSDCETQAYPMNKLFDPFFFLTKCHFSFSICVTYCYSKDINIAVSHYLNVERYFSQTLVLNCITLASSQLVIQKWSLLEREFHRQQVIFWTETVFGGFGCSMILIPP